MRVAEPFHGIGGFRRAMELFEVPFTTVNAFEKDPRFASFYRALKLTHVRVGDAGDVRSIQPEMLEDCEGLVCGAPCTPWAGSGKRLGVLDERAELFDIVVTWIIELAHRGCLLFFACENSPNVLQAEGKGTRAPYLQRVMALLHVAIPFFDIEVQVVDLYPMLPQTRTRAWLRGIRKDVSLGHPMPAVLKLLPEVTLEQFLDPSLPNRSLECISLKAKRNLIACMSKVQEDTVTGKAGNIAVVETHRAFGAKYGAVTVRQGGQHRGQHRGRGDPPCFRRKVWIQVFATIEEGEEPCPDWRSGRYPIRMTDLFPQRRSRARPRRPTWPASLARDDLL
jgi:site-specific DNA-cytosine methylase